MDSGYSNISKYHLGQLVCRKLDNEIPRDVGQVVWIEFLMGGSVKYGITWRDGTGGDGYEGELISFDECNLLGRGVG